MSATSKPFQTLNKALAKGHRENPSPTRFAMVGMCLVNIERDRLHFFSEEETASIFMVIFNAMDAERKESGFCLKDGGADRECSHTAGHAGPCDFVRRGEE